MNPVKSNNRDTDSHLKKLGLGSAAAAAMYLAPGLANQAEADVVHVTTPVSISFGGGTVNWDIDGDAAPDFLLQTFFTTSMSIQGGGAFVSNNSTFNDQVLNLGPATGSSFLDIGPTLPAPYRFGATGSTVFYRTLISSAGNSFGADAVGFTDGVAGFVGFRFLNVNTATTNYGWASMTLNLGGAGASIVINEWAFDDMGRAIHVGDTGAIPEPTGLGGLALLALGAAGVRRRKNQAK